MPTYLATLLFNTNHRNAMCDGYTSTDVMRATELGTVAIDAAGLQSAAAQIFELFNADDRPNGATERSMCVGDVVQITGQADATAYNVYLACEPTGWRLVFTVPTLQAKQSIPSW